MVSKSKPSPLILLTPPGSASDADLEDDPSRSIRRSPILPRPVHDPALSLPLSRTYSDLIDYPPTPTSPSTPSKADRFTFAYLQSRGRHRLLHSDAFWLFLYFMFNLGLTLYNKLVLIRFPFPYTLTAFHTFSGTIGSYLAMELGYFVPEVLTTRESIILTAFSVLYTMNIAISNLSLQLVTVPFHQVVRAASPLFVIALSWLLLGRPLSSTKVISITPVIVGVGFATYGDYYYTVGGLLLTLLGTVLAAFKTIVTHLLQTGCPTPNHILPGNISPRRPIKLHPLGLLLRMSPLAFVQCVVYAHFSGELDRVREYSARNMNYYHFLALAVNGAMAFGLNVVSFTANSKVGPLSITVAANVKQVLTICLAVSIFDLVITPANALGIALTLLGGAWYAAIEYRERRHKNRLSAVNPTSIKTRRGL